GATNWALLTQVAPAIGSPQLGRWDGPPIVFSEADYHPLLALLQQKKIDFAVGPKPIRDSDYPFAEFIPLGKPVPLSFICPPSHERARDIVEGRLESMTVEELVREREVFMLPPGLQPGMPAPFAARKWLEKPGITTEPHYSTILACV